MSTKRYISCSHCKKPCRSYVYGVCNDCIILFKAGLTLKALKYGVYKGSPIWQRDRDLSI